MNNDKLSFSSIGSLGRSIKVCRIERGIKQKELAERANTTASYLSLIEAGLRDPGIATLLAICKVLDIPAHVLLYKAAMEEDNIYSDKALSIKALTSAFEKMSYGLYKLDESCL